MTQEDQVKKVEDMSFEESFAKLDELVQKLENGGLDLDKSLEVYEQAIALRDHCRKILEQSERRVQKIMEISSEGVEKVDFNP
jgi:exodeoxyribonuclease VII small subunit